MGHLGHMTSHVIHRGGMMKQAGDGKIALAKPGKQRVNNVNMAIAISGYIADM